MMKLDPKLEEQIVNLFSANSHVTKVVLFGSRARGDADERSDIDLAIYALGIDEREKAKLTCLVDDLTTLLPVDIIWIDEASQPLKEQIARDGMAIYELNQSETKHE